MNAAPPSPPAPPVLVLTAPEVEALSDWADAVAALREAYSGEVTEAMVPPRSMARAPGVWLRGLTAVSTSGQHVGAKLITVSTTNSQASYLVSLMDRQTAQLVALMDGNHITGLRTAATSAMCTDLAAPQRPLTVAVIGSGFEAHHHLVSLAAVREVASARVFSPTPERRAAFAAAVSEEIGAPVTAVDSPEDAVAGADVVICAARARGEVPTLQGAWLEPGMTVVSIGSTLPEQREVDPGVLARAGRIICDHVEEVVHDTGDFIAAREAGVHAEERVVGLADVAGGRVPARASDDEIVLYKSVGTALQDIVVAEMLLRRARERGVGTSIAPPIQPVTK